MARIGSTRPELVEKCAEPAATCWITAALDCAKTMSGCRSASLKKPFSTATDVGQKLADEEPTESSVTVSAAKAGREDEANARASAAGKRRFIRFPPTRLRRIQSPNSITKR